MPPPKSASEQPNPCRSGEKASPQAQVWGRIRTEKDRNTPVRRAKAKASTKTEATRVHETMEDMAKQEASMAARRAQARKAKAARSETLISLEEAAVWRNRS